jgi:putative transposase
MPRAARIVVPHQPHHVVQRGNRRQAVFFADGDYALYKRLLAEQCEAAGVAIWAWCLMPNHVHLMAVPAAVGGLAVAIGETHKRYTREINRRHGWVGHLWQGRFSSCPMDEPHALMAARYIERNPDRARLVLRPEDWRWSSTRAHLEGIDDGLTSHSTLEDLVKDWRAYLDDTPPSWEADRLRRHVRTGRPLGGEQLLAAAEKATGRTLGRGRRRTAERAASERNG